MAGASIPATLNVADYFLDRHLREGRGARVAVRGVGTEVTYQELAERAGRVARAWRGLGLQAGSGAKPGDRVLLVLPDSPEFIACFLGTIKAGGVAVPVNPFTRSPDYAYYAGDCRPRLAVVHVTSLAEALPALTAAQSAPRVLTVGERAGGRERLEDVLGAGGASAETHASSAEHIAFFLYTSGSGGQPKAALHGHRHMLVTADAFGRQVLGVRPDDVVFSASKLFFAYGLGNSLTFPLSVGASSVLLPEKPTPEKLLEVMARYRPTLFFAVPTLYGALLRAAAAKPVALDSVRACVSAGERLPEEIFHRFRERLGREILDGIGTTEMLHMFMSNCAGQARAGSCGRLVPGYEARIVDEKGAEVGNDEIGNLWVKGGSAFAGYWDKPELTAKAKPVARGEEWYVPGDKFTRDRDGYYYYHGRADDMLKVSGMWVSPLEVENALLAHEAVAEAAVVGRRTEEGLTRVAAFVVLKAPSAERFSPAALQGEPSGQAPAAGEHSALSEELRAFVRRRLPGYKCPQAFTFVAELPKTATGKIQRFKLRGQREGREE